MRIMTRSTFPHRNDFRFLPGAEEPAAGEAAPRRVMLRAKGRLILVDAAAVHWIDAAANHVRFNLASGSHKVRATLADVERSLPAGRFLRIHRSTIVNLDAVTEFARGRYGDLVAVLRTGKRLSVGRRYRKALQANVSIIRKAPGR
jgi:two-component system LytT family response regulator